MWSVGIACGEDYAPTLQVRVGALHDFLPEGLGIEKTNDLSGSSSGVPIAAIAGGVVAAIVVLIIILVLCLYCVRNRKKKKTADETDFGNASVPAMTTETGVNTEGKLTSAPAGELQNMDSAPEPLPLPENWGTSQPESGADALSQPMPGDNPVPPSVPPQYVAPPDSPPQPPYEWNQPLNQPDPGFVQPMGPGEQPYVPEYQTNLPPPPPDAHYGQPMVPPTSDQVYLQNQNASLSPPPPPPADDGSAYPPSFATYDPYDTSRQDPKGPPSSPP